jgi:HEAT repeat protein
MTKSFNVTFFIFIVICLILAISNCASNKKKDVTDKYKEGAEGLSVTEYFLSKKDSNELKDHWIKSNNLSVRTKIVKVLEKRNDTDSLLYLLDMATYLYAWRKSLDDLSAFHKESPSYKFRIQSTLVILQALGNLKDPKATNSIIKLLTNTNDEIRQEALVALGNIKDPSSKESIYGVLYDEVPLVRIEAIRALGEIGDAEAVDRISILLADKNSYVRNTAESVLIKLGVSEEKLADWKIKAEQLSLEDVYRSKLAYQKVLTEKEELQSKLNSETEIKQKLELSLADLELALEKQKKLAESRYENERELKSKLAQLNLAKQQSEEYQIELENLNKSVENLNKELKQAKTKSNTESVKEELDKTLLEKSKLEADAKLSQEKEANLQNEVADLSALASKTRLEAEEAKKEVVDLQRREKQLAAQVDELKQRLNREMAPVVVVSKPTDGAKIESPNTLLHFIAIDDKGIRNVDVYLNGNPVIIDHKRGLKIVADEESYSKKIDVVEKLQLQNGQNMIKISVVDIDGISQEEVLHVTKVKERGEIWAIVIGINQYQNTRNLKYAVNDAQAFKDYLKDYVGIPDEHIFYLANKDATKLKIGSLLGTTIKRKASRDDTVIIFYAGHGAVETDSSNPDGDGFEKYLLPYDANLNDLYTTSISMDEVRRIFARIHAERLIFIADTCYSGASGGRTMMATKTRANLSDKFYERISKGKGRVIISSCSANEISKEDDKLQHGVFSYYMLEGLKGRADQDGDGIITVSELFSYISRKVPQASAQDQHPVKKGETEGELVIGRTK